MKADGGSSGAGRPAVMTGTVPWLDRWVAHAQRGAVLIVDAPGPMTHMVDRALAERCRALVDAGLIIALWVDVGDRKTGRQWEWRATRTGRDLPPLWPKLTAPGLVVRAQRAVKPPAVVDTPAGASRSRPMVAA